MWYVLGSRSPIGPTSSAICIAAHYLPVLILILILMLINTAGQLSTPATDYRIHVNVMLRHSTHNVNININITDRSISTSIQDLRPRLRSQASEKEYIHVNCTYMCEHTSNAVFIILITRSTRVHVYIHIQCQVSESDHWTELTKWNQLHVHVVDDTVSASVHIITRTVLVLERLKKLNGLNWWSRWSPF